VIEAFHEESLMTRIRSFAVLGLLTAFVVAVGCGKKPESAPEPNAEIAPEAKPIPEDADKAAKVIAVERLKEIGKGLSQTRELSPGIINSKGDIGLSWRVALLPYVGQKSLYKEFKLDESWDSDHNKKLIAKMPQVYASPEKSAPEGQTYLRSFVGESACIPAPRENAAKTHPGVPAKFWIGMPEAGRLWVTYKDGTNYTLIVAEATEPVEWTKPEDLSFHGNPRGPNSPAVPKLGGPFLGGFHGLMADGNVYFFPNLKDDELRAIITVDGNDRELGVNTVERIASAAKLPPIVNTPAPTTRR
jgi:hypothetical protein